MSLNPSKIDYLYHARELIGRDGRSLNIVTGCRHHETDICTVPCYAKRLVETRFVDSPAYPYGFEPTFHPHRIREYRGKPKLIFLNDMGDIGGNWNWKECQCESEQFPKADEPMIYSEFALAAAMKEFAELNYEHIILLLTKNPAWYRYHGFPDNVWCGFTATNNEEFEARWKILDHLPTVRADRRWVSLEPWLDEDAPYDPSDMIWLVLGGQTNPNRGIGVDVMKWLYDMEAGTPKNPRIFVKKNSGWLDTLREYPDAFKLQGG